MLTTRRGFLGMLIALPVVGRASQTYAFDLPVQRHIYYGVLNDIADTLRAIAAELATPLPYALDRPADPHPE